MSFVGIAVTFFFVIAGWNVPPGMQSGFGGEVVHGRFALFFKGIFLIAAALTVLITDRYMHREECNHGELYPLILLATAGMMLMAVGFSFKIAAVPFHMWTPDVYEGAPTPMTAFMAVGPKAAGFAAFVRVFTIALPSLKPDWTPLLWGLAALTMTVGNIIGLYQINIKRMLAYSAIAHAGYALVGFTAGNAEGIAGILFYMLTYAFMNIGAFTVVILVGRKGEKNGNVGDYAGLAYKHPLLAACMAIFLFSLAGLPPTAGFNGKFYLFSSAIKGGFIWLAVIGVLNAWCRSIITPAIKQMNHAA
jgi:NADH-quinone oxidoreductase subunit N